MVYPRHSLMAGSVINKQRLNRLAGRLAAHYVRWVYRSSNPLVSKEELRDNVEKVHPCIFAFWHGQFMLIPAFSPVEYPVANMVARHGDAELIGEVLKSFDHMSLIRGSGSGGRQKRHGGTTALRESLRRLESNVSIAMTADVPPGPPRVAGEGIVKLAQMSGRPIIPVAAASSRFRTLRTWSRMTVNLPFSDIIIRTGEPIHVPADLDNGEVETYRQLVESSLNATTRQAYDEVGADWIMATPHAAQPTDAPAAAPGLKLNTYRAATKIMTNVAPLILRHRERRGKEDPDRRDERLGIASKSRPDGPLAWIHAASVGETNAILPLIDGLRQERPDVRFLLTTGTITSAALAAERMTRGDVHQFAPLDVPQCVARFLDHWQPGLAILTESELWPNTIIDCYKRDIPIAIVNGRMSERSYRRWRKNKSLALPLFSRLRLVLAQSEKLVRHFQELGARDVRLTGNIKVDAPKLPVDTIDLARMAEAIGQRPCWAATSTHAGEDEAVIEAHTRLAPDHPGLLTIIAPRHPERGPEIAEYASRRG